MGDLAVCPLFLFRKLGGERKSAQVVVCLVSHNEPQSPLSPLLIAPSREAAPGDFFLDLVQDEFGIHATLEMRNVEIADADSGPPVVAMEVSANHSTAHPRPPPPFCCLSQSRAQSSRALCGCTLSSTQHTARGPSTPTASLAPGRCAAICLSAPTLGRFSTFSLRDGWCVVGKGVCVCGGWDGRRVSVIVVKKK